MQFRDICFGGAPPINRADELGAFFPTMSLHLAGGLNLTLSPLNYLFLHASEVTCRLSILSIALQVTRYCGHSRQLAHSCPAALHVGWFLSATCTAICTARCAAAATMLSGSAGLLVTTTPCLRPMLQLPAYELAATPICICL